MTRASAHPTTVACAVLLLVTVHVGGTALTAAAAAVECGAVITRSTVLSADLFCDGGFGDQSPALALGAPGITLDLGGHVLHAGERVGIANRGFDDVTITNGTIATFVHAVVIEGVEGGVVTAVATSSFDGKGVLVRDATNVTVADNHVHESVILHRVDRSVVRGNRVAGSNVDGLIVRGHNNAVVDNVLEDHLGTALWLEGDRNAVVGNVLRRSTGWGFVVGGHGNRIAYNEVAGSDGGIEIGTVRTASGTVLYRNHTHENRGNGITVAGGNTVIKDNVSSGNTGWGIFAEGPVVDAQGNVAFDNGAGQCFGLTCEAQH